MTQAVLHVGERSHKPYGWQALPPQAADDLIGPGFDVTKFAANFGVLVDAVGGTKHLRELVLQLAVRGRLTEDGTDSAASLVTNLALARTGPNLAGTRLPPWMPVGNDEEPYAVPASWLWIRVAALGGFAGGGTPSKSNAAFWKGPIPWVSPKDMKRLRIDDAEDHISAAAIGGSAVKLIPRASVLYVVRGMILAHSFPVALTEREVTINQDMKALVLALPEMADFVLLTLQAAKPRVLAMVERSSHGTCRLDGDIVERLPIALPPLAQQKRIVAKVDQLMALCDELEVRQTKKREVGVRFSKSALDTLTTAAGPEKFDAAWRRVEQNFDLVAVDGAAARDLRRVVLRLGCTGRLSARSTATDVNAVLRELRSDHTGAVRRGVPELVEQPAQVSAWSLPAQWAAISVAELLRVGELVDVKDGNHGANHPLAAEYVADGVPFIMASNVREQIDYDGAKKLPPDVVARLRVGLAEPGDVIYTHKGSVGRVALNDRKCVLTPQTTYYRVRARPRLLSREYLRLALLSPLHQDQLAGVQQQTTRDFVPVSRQYAVFLPIPPLDEQRDVVRRMNLLLGLCDDLATRLDGSQGLANRLVQAAVEELCPR